MTQPSAQRVLIVVGTRPEAIKLAPVAEALAQRSEVETRIALTGQHTDLVDQVLDVFDLTPAWDLNIMRDGQTLYDIAQGCLDGLRQVFRDYEPDIILVQGDTATVFFAGIVAFFERTRVGHVEAGLRSGDKWRPYPEEIFRRLTGVVSDLHFAPTPGARENLLREGVNAEQVFLTGNTVVDALQKIAAQKLAPRSDAVRRAVDDPRRLILMTAHRRESFGQPLRDAFSAVRTLVDDTDDAILLYPVHPNPNVLEPAREVLGGHDRIVLCEPVDYFDLVAALGKASLVLTDSGGIQEEAPSFGVPVLVLREVTERPEGVAAGAAELVGTDPRRILEAGRRLLSDGGRDVRVTTNPYGDGHAGERIADIVVHSLTGAARRTVDWTGVA